jgi:hypothetical protein
MAKHYDRCNRRLEIFNKYNGHCAYCGCELSKSNFAVDHIEPIFRGSTDAQLNWYKRERGIESMENYNPCCKSCNSSKSTFTLEMWRSEISKKFDRMKRDCSSYSLMLRFGFIEEKRDKILFYFERQQNG